MKITNLKVQNFKAFYGEIDKPYEFDFLGKDGNAKNILLYGENGSGKSSLYWTLHHVFTTTNKTIESLQDIKEINTMLSRSILISIVQVEDLSWTMESYSPSWEHKLDYGNL